MGCFEHKIAYTCLFIDFLQTVSGVNRFPGENEEPKMMLTIRRKQLQLLSARRAESFEVGMLNYIKENFKDQYELLGANQVKQILREGVKKAGSYGVIAERDVCWFIDMMFLFGRKFDKDSAHPWASEILNDPSINDGSIKTKLLRKAAEDHEKEAGRSPF
jgi:hypothetical protein